MVQPLHVPLVLLCLSSARGAVSPKRSSGAPANDEPRLKFSNSVRPCLRLRKTIQALGTQLSLGARPHATDSPPHARITPASHRTGADCHVLEKEATFEASWRDVWLGGELSLSDLSQLKWSKTWIFPGLADAATRVEVKSTLDLKTARPDVRFKLGLRRPFAPPGLSFVHDVPLDGKNGKAKLSVGATVTVPVELQLSAADVPAVVGGRGKAEVGAALQPRPCTCVVPHTQETHGPPLSSARRWTSSSRRTWRSTSTD